MEIWISFKNEPSFALFSQRRALKDDAAVAHPREKVFREGKKNMEMLVYKKKEGKNSKNKNYIYS